MNIVERQNTKIIADIMGIAYDINKLDGLPIINIALNGQKFQMHTYKDNKCYMRIIDLNANPSELLFLKSNLIADLLLKGGGENLCD